MNNAQKQPVWFNQNSIGKPIQVGDHKYTMPQQDYPHSDMDEQAVIACILNAGELGRGTETFRRVPFLRYDDFWNSNLGYIFRACERLHLQKLEIDVSSVITELSGFKMPDGKMTLLDKVGGDKTVHDLAAQPVGVNLETYARNVVRAALGRATMLASVAMNKLGSMAMAKDIVQLESELPRIIREIQSRLHALTEENTFNLHDAIDLYEKEFQDDLENDDYQPGYNTGFFNLDKITLGWRKEKLYIIAAPNGWGKTVFMLNSAVEQLRQGRRVVFISLEMPLGEMVERIICMTGQIDYTHLQERKLSEAERNRWARANNELRDWLKKGRFTMVVMDEPTLDQLDAKLNELRLTTGFDMVFVDYIGPDTIGKDYPREEEGSVANRAYKELKRWKKFYRVPIIVTAQMNSKWTPASKRKPIITDLYYGTAARAAADFVAFIYHEKLVHGDDAETDLAELLIRKNRSGRTGDEVTAELIWEPEYQTFTSEGDYDPR